MIRVGLCLGNRLYNSNDLLVVMASFTWEESALTADCITLEDMARRFEETAVLMRRLDRHGFELHNNEKIRQISHRNVRTFSRFGFVIDKKLSEIRNRAMHINSDTFST